MGIFNTFKKKEISNFQNFKQHLTNSFSSIKADLSNQNRWIEYLHRMHLATKSSHDTHKQSVKADIENIKGHVTHVKSNVIDINEDMDNVTKWIEYLHSNAKLHEEKLASMEKSIKVTLEAYNKHLKHMHELVDKAHVSARNATVASRDAYSTARIANNNAKGAHTEAKDAHAAARDAHDAANIAHSTAVTAHNTAVSAQDIAKSIVIPKPLTLDKDKLKQELLTEISREFTPPKMAVPKPEIIYKDAPLTNPEQKLLNLLFNESGPLSYDQVSQKTGNSINTVRVNMNMLKKKGLIEENMLPNGVKLFNLNNKEKIKKIYNLQIL